MRLTPFLGAFLLAGCSAILPEPPSMPALATAQVAEDFDTYRLRRIGLMPFEGADVTVEQAAGLKSAFFSELSLSTPFELVPLDGRDLEEVHESDPYRRGWYSPDTVVDLSRRYSLDAILFGTVTQSQFFPPQKLSVQVDMVAAETGLVIWSSSVHLDASEERVREGLEVYFTTPDGDDEDGRDWRMALLSPSRFAQFAAYQIASLL